MSTGQSLPSKSKEKRKKRRRRRRRRRRGNIKEEGKKSDEEQCGQSPCAKCATTHGHFRPKMMSNFSLKFSLHFREKTF